MNQIQKRVSTMSSDTQKTKRSFSAVFLGSALVLAFQLFAVIANAVNIPITSFTCTQTPTATTVCVVNGAFANGWFSPGGGYWQYVLNTNGYTGINMTFNHTKSAAAGPTSGQVYYNLSDGTGDHPVTGGAFTVTTSCQTKSVTLPSVCEGVSGLIIRVKMTGATANTATHRITGVNVFDGSSTSCTTMPASGGTITAAANPVCAGTSSTLTLTGATGGSGISYKWQSSLNGSSWSDIVPAATGLSYTAPNTLTDTMYYRAVTTCSAVPLSPAYSNTLRLDVNTVNIANITGYTAPLIVGTTQNLSNATPGGLWISSTPSVATVSDLGVLSGVFGGTTNISYQVTDPVNGCIGSKTITVNSVWTNTLALYAGSTGSNTNVINVPGDVTSTLYAKGFGTLATQCGSGGYSGLTMNAAVDTALNLNGPHVGYYVMPVPDSALNMYRIHARMRVSGDGPTKAVIAYRFKNAGTFNPWQVSADTLDLVSGSCGDMKNEGDYFTGSITNPNPTETGITDTLEVAVFPYAPVSNGGTFQLGSLEVYGIVTNDNACTGTPVVAADSALPAVFYICDTGYVYLNYNWGTGGIAGVGKTYAWQFSTDGGTTWDYTDDGVGIVYRFDDTASAIADTTYFRVQVFCGATVISTSEPSMVVTRQTPANAGTISGGLTSTILPQNHMFVDGGTTYTMSSSVTGGEWTSNDTSVVSIVRGTGVATPHLPGDAIITYRLTNAGCFASSKDTVIALYKNTQAFYLGTGGNSTHFYVAGNAAPNATADITTANWTSGVTCGNGGISGLVNATVSPDAATNGRVVMSVKAAGATPVTVREIRATVRKQPSGNYMTYLGVSPAGANSWTLSTPEAVESDDCGYSHNEIVYHFASPVTLTNTVGGGYDFAVFAYNGDATPPAKTFQVNTISIIDTTGAASQVQKPTGINELNAANSIQLYPNPAENTLNVDATENVNVAIFSIDGKKLLEAKNTKSINVSTLVSGMYIVTVSDANNMLLKTDKFVKK